MELICASYARLRNASLAPEKLRGDELVRFLDTAPFVLVSHGMEEDPLFNYANQRALRLWEMTREEFLGLPSRYSAELEHRGERERLLADVAKKGFSEDYSGVRASKSGRRFRIERALVFNLVDASGRKRGQAATFSDWTYL